MATPRPLVATVADPVGVADEIDAVVGRIDVVGGLAARVAARVPLERHAGQWGRVRPERRGNGARCALSVPVTLFIQRLCPPTKTAAS